VIDPETRDVLISVLQVLREQTNYLHRQHGWVIAASETIEKHPDLAAELKAHSFYDQGPRPDVHITASLIQQVDTLIRKLRG